MPKKSATRKRVKGKMGEGQRPTPVVFCTCFRCGDVVPAVFVSLSDAAAIRRVLRRAKAREQAPPKAVSERSDVRTTRPAGPAGPLNPLQLSLERWNDEEISKDVS